jgi:hypothetical protein
MQRDETYEAEIIAFLEGERTGDPSDTLVQYFDSPEACAAEFESLKTVWEDLDALGTAGTIQAGPVDLVDAVMQAVDHTQVEPSNTVSLADRRRSRGLVGAAWASLAAAAAVALVLWVKGPMSPEVDGPSQQVATTEQTDHSTSQPESAQSEDEAKAIALAKLQDVFDELAEQVGTPYGDVIPDSEVVLESVTLDDVLQLRRDAITTDEAKAQLYQMASLREDAARTLVARADASPEVLLGASQSLPAAEAHAALLRAQESLVDEPYIHLALANSAQELNEADAYSRRVSDLDPDNALPLYGQAVRVHEAGDAVAARALLKEAGTLSSATGYPIRSARARSAALAAKGMRESAAQMATALTLGAGEYEYLTDFGRALMAYGEASEALGDYELAREYYEAVRQLGLQLDFGSPAMNERLAGLDLQREAIAGLAGVLEPNGDANLAALAEDAEMLSASFTEWSEVIDGLEGLISTDIETEALLSLAEEILQLGDVSL